MYTAEVLGHNKSSPIILSEHAFFTSQSASKAASPVTPQEWINAEIPRSSLYISESISTEVLENKPEPHQIRFDPRVTKEQMLYEEEHGREPTAPEKIGAAMFDAIMDIAVASLKIPQTVIKSLKIAA